MATLEIYDTPDGHGYRILVDGTCCIDQPFHPEREGFSPMSEAEARTLGAAVLALYNTPAE